MIGHRLLLFLSVCCISEITYQAADFLPLQQLQALNGRANIKEMKPPAVPQAQTGQFLSTGVCCAKVFLTSSNAIFLSIREYTTFVLGQFQSVANFTYNGRPAYFHSSGGSCLWFLDNGYWGINSCDTSLNTTAGVVLGSGGSSCPEAATAWQFFNPINVSMVLDRTMNVSCQAGTTPTAGTTSTIDPTATTTTATPIDCYCGVSGVSKIVGGVNALQGELPWQAALVATGNTLPFCGGSLISSRTVLTAAHCNAISVNSFVVILGANDLSSPSTGQKSYVPASIVSHPNFVSATLNNDFAVITLATAVVFSPSISPICLPLGAGAVHENKKSIISGWGRLETGGPQPNILQKANVTTMSNAACTSPPNAWFNSTILSSMICANSPGKGICQGDSGGPLIIPAATGYSYELIGVTSFTANAARGGCQNDSYPGGFARVSTAVGWIQTQLTGTVCPASTTNSTAPATTTKSSTVPATTTPSTISDCPCGVSGVSKIVGGVDAVPGEFPWQVALVPTGRTLPFCGGSLISSRTILTAAHCNVYSVNEFSVVLGAHNLASPPTGQRSYVPVSFVSHPSYNNRTEDNDFAIITLSTDVSFNSTIGTICLPLGAGTVHENKLDTISGWGTLSSGGSQPYVLQKANVTTMSNTACTSPPYSYTSRDILPSMICAASPGKDTCQGDSGGPMVSLAATGLSYELIGVTSWGTGCAIAAYPGVYARVSQQKDWILSLMTGTVCQAPTTATTKTTATNATAINSSTGIINTTTATNATAISSSTGIINTTTASNATAISSSTGIINTTTATNATAISSSTGIINTTTATYATTSIPNTTTANNSTTSIINTTTAIATNTTISTALATNSTTSVNTYTVSTTAALTTSTTTQVLPVCPDCNSVVTGNYIGLYKYLSNADSRCPGGCVYYSTTNTSAQFCFTPDGQDSVVSCT